MYRYEVAKFRLDHLLNIRTDTGISVARQLDYAIDSFCERYLRGSDERDALVRYATSQRVDDRMEGD